ncbi:ABC transporter substrate-binding protein [Cellulomonas endophytica]|uniref:ABC transporter substrate-binding protein n=1 Tax=Cellulomonas endophytica TaxID=2494735 RepID=UPI0010133967|nr:ABC transporter substrate-binding protein [Cellulomonas endophytica]
MTLRTTPLALGAATLTAALLLAGCAGESSPAGADGEDLSPLRFALPTQMGANNAPLAVAASLGYFMEEGLDVEIINTSDSTSIVQGVDSGSIEIGSTPPEPLWQTVAAGGDVTLVYNYIRQQTGSVVSLADGPVQSLDDLEGKAVGQSSLGSSNLLLSNGILASVGLEEDVDFTNVAVGTGAAALQALETDQVQALSLWDTEYAAFEETGAVLNYFTTPEVEQLFSTTYFTSPEYLASNADEVAAFGRAMARATLFTSTNPAAALQVMYEGYPETRLAGVGEEEQLATDLVALERRIVLLNAGDPQAHGTWGAYTPEAVEAWAEFAASAGIVDAPIDASAHVSTDLVEQYNDFDADAVVAQAQDWSADA